jgi:hypothetical protein
VPVVGLSLGFQGDFQAVFAMGAWVRDIGWLPGMGGRNETCWGGCHAGALPGKAPGGLACGYATTEAAKLSCNA